MKILQISYSLSSGGAERFVVDLSNELSQKGHDVHILTILDDKIDDNNFYRDQVTEKVNYSNLGLKKGFTISKILKLNRFIRQCKPDIVHFQGVNIILFFLLPILFYRKPKYIETLHNMADIIFTKERFSYITIPIYKYNLVKLCCISGINKSSLENVTGILNSTLIYNGRKKTNNNKPSQNTICEIENLKTNSNDIVFIHIGRCSYQKNQELLIDAFNELEKKGYNFILLIIGAGFETELGRTLESKSCAKIHFLGTKKNIFDYLENSDAFCLSSLFEGMPISLIEAFSCGCVPISTPVSGIIDVIDNEQNGFISSDFSLVSYINTLESYIENHKKMDKDLLYETYSNYFSIENCADKYLKTYKNLLEK